MVDCLVVNPPYSYEPFFDIYVQMNRAAGCAERSEAPELLCISNDVPNALYHIPVLWIPAFPAGMTRLIGLALVRAAIYCPLSILNFPTLAGQGDVVRDGTGAGSVGAHGAGRHT